MYGGCGVCSKKSMSEKLRISDSEFLSRSINIHGNKYNYDKVIKEHQISNINSKVDIYCNKCGKYFSQTIRDHIYSKAGCPICGRETTRLKTQTPKEIIIERLENEFGNMYLNLIIKFREKLLRNNESISSEKFRFIAGNKTLFNYYFSILM